MIINGDGFGRGVVEQQQDVRQQSVATGQVDDPSATEFSSYSSGHFPGLEMFLGRERPGPATSVFVGKVQCPGLQVFSGLNRQGAKNVSFRARIANQGKEKQG